MHIGLQIPEVGILSFPCEQIAVAAPFNHASFFHHENMVRHLNTSQSVCDEQRCLSLCDFRKRLKEAVLTARVQCQNTS